MLGIAKSYDIGKAIAKRVKGFQVWDSLPKKILKKHPKAFVICPNFKVKIPKILTKLDEETYHILRVRMVSDDYEKLLKMRDHMIQCGYAMMIAEDKAFWLHAVNMDDLEKKGKEWRTALTYIFRLRPLSLTEQKNFTLTEDKNG